MDPGTLDLWQKQDRHKGDRKRLFTAAREAVGGVTVLYPGSYVDIAASMVFPSVMYIDVDERASGFFADTEGVAEIIVSEGEPASGAVEFIHADYTGELGIENETYDMLVSLYAGFVSEACTRYLRVGGVLLVAPSHGDAAMASIDPRYELSGIVASRSGNYHVRTDSLDTYLVPRSDTVITKALLHERGKGIAYTKSPFAYLFTRTN